MLWLGTLPLRCNTGRYDTLLHTEGRMLGWLVGFWCTHFRDSAPLINSFSRFGTTH